MMLYSPRASPNGRSVAKSKPISAPGPSRPEEDEEMMDVDYDPGVQEHDEHMHSDEDHADDEEMGKKSGDERQDGGNEKRGEQATEASESRHNPEETMAMFDFRHMGGVKWICGSEFCSTTSSPLLTR